MIGTVAAIMASTIINVAVPDMSRVFGLGQERAQWLSAGFMAAMTQGRSLPDCARVGCIAAAEVISHYGARTEADLKALVNARLGARLG